MGNTLTTGRTMVPECDESLIWIIDTDIREISESQLDFFAVNWAKNTAFAGGNGNNRAV
jgi:hypothetical protein